jgi:hypothetical protein
MTQDMRLIQIEQLDRIIVVLEHARSRPGMYWQNANGFWHFIRGFESARKILFNTPENTLIFDVAYNEAFREHGLPKPAATDIYGLLVYNGFGTRYARHTHLDVLILMYKKARAKLAALPDDEQPADHDSHKDD